MDRIIQKASLIGQVIEDLTYEALSLQRFEAQLIETKKSPQYKNDGFFVFSDLAPGEYTLRIFGDRFQTQQYTVSIPLATSVFASPPDLDLSPIFDAPGDNEMAVIAKTVNGGGSKITFDPVILKKQIRKGGPVVTSSSVTRLTETLDIGRRTEAKMENVAGIIPGDIVRIVRDRSIRMKFDPYHRFPFTLTHVFGNVVSRMTPGMPLPSVQLRLIRVNGTNVVLSDVGDARVATVGSVVLGAEKDVVTLTNQRGDYNFYFEQGRLAVDVTLEASLAGYQPQTTTITISELARNRADFELVRS